MDKRARSPCRLQRSLSLLSSRRFRLRWRRRRAANGQAARRWPRQAL